MFRGSDEWQRSVQMYRDMLDCKGEIVLGSGWMLACWMGRGSRKDQIIKKKKHSPYNSLNAAFLKVVAEFFLTFNLSSGNSESKQRKNRAEHGFFFA